MESREVEYARIRREGGARPHPTIAMDLWSFTSGGRDRDLPLPGGWCIRIIVEMRDDKDLVELSVGPSEEIHGAWRIIFPADMLEVLAQMFIEEAGTRQERIERTAIKSESGR